MYLHFDVSGILIISCSYLVLICRSFRKQKNRMLIELQRRRFQTLMEEKHSAGFSMHTVALAFEFNYLNCKCKCCRSAHEAILRQFRKNCKIPVFKTSFVGLFVFTVIHIEILRTESKSIVKCLPVLKLSCHNEKPVLTISTVKYKNSIHTTAPVMVEIE